MPFDAIRRLFLRLLRGVTRGRAKEERPTQARRRSGRKGRKRQARPSSALGTFGARMGHHAGIYGGGQAGALLLNLVSLAVLTRFLEPAQFGVYALYYIASMLLGMVYALGWVRGALILVFGGRGGDEDDDDDDLDDEEEQDEKPFDEAATVEEKRSALGTALVFVSLIAAVGTVAVAASASAVAELLAGPEGEGRLAVLTGLAGATGALWILGTSVLRRERRPKTFVAASLSRPALVLTVTVPLVVVDPDVEKAVLGLALGTAASALVALFAIRHSFRVTLNRTHLRAIIRAGIQYTPLIVSLFVIANGGVLLLGQYADESDVGIFRVAVGLAALASLPVGAFITAWGPLRKEPIYGAVEAERGRLAASGLLASYFVLAALWILLTLAVGADLLVRVAPGTYGDAAPLIPIIGLGLLLYGAFRVARRTAKFPRKANWYIVLAVVGAVVFIVACLLLIPPLGTYGAALAGVAAFFTAAVGMLARSQLGANPIPFTYGRILGGLAIAGVCFAIPTLLEDAAGPLDPVIRVVAILVYPVLLAVTGIVPRGHLLPLRRVATAAFPGGAAGTNGRVDLNGLDDVHRAVLEVLIRHRRPLGDVAAVVRAPPGALEASFVEALREVAGVERASQADPKVGAYLLSSSPVAARDAVWRRLSSEGADALEVDALTLTLKRLRAAPEKAWRRP